MRVNGAFLQQQQSILLYTSIVTMPACRVENNNNNNEFAFSIDCIVPSHTSVTGNNNVPEAHAVAAGECEVTNDSKRVKNQNIIAFCYCKFIFKPMDWPWIFYFIEFIILFQRFLFIFLLQLKWTINSTRFNLPKNQLTSVQNFIFSNTAKMLSFPTEAKFWALILIWKKTNLK